MSDYRDANDPLQRGRTPYDLNAGDGGGALAWIAGAILVVILVAFAVGINHTNTTNNSGPNVASNNMPTLNQPASPPAGPASRSFTPTPINPSNPSPPNPPSQQSK
jgi:hypothetical protein